MKIAINTRFLLPDKLEGIGKFTHEIASRLVRLFPEHEFYFFFDRKYDARFVYGPSVRPIVIQPPARHPFLFYLWFQFGVRRALQKIKPDVFLSTDGMTVLETDIPRVTVMHDLAFEHFPADVDFISRKYYQYYSPRFAAVSDRILAVSEFTRQDIREQYGVHPAKIKVVYNDAGPLFKPVNFEKQGRYRIPCIQRFRW